MPFPSKKMPDVPSDDFVRHDFVSSLLASIRVHSRLNIGLIFLSPFSCQKVSSISHISRFPRFGLRLY